MGDMKTIIALVSLGISAIAIVVTLVIYKITKRRENYQNLLQHIIFYLGPEMHTAVHQLWNLYRDYGDPDFIDKYIEIMIAEDKKINSLQVTERMEYQLSTLHYQRRIVSSFWRRLAVLLKNRLIPKRAVFDLWYRDDVDIVCKIIIPIENRLCEHLKIKRLNPKTEPLYYIANLRNRFDC